MDGDSNDIPFNSYNIDFGTIFERIFDGGGAGIFSFFSTVYDQLVLWWNIYTALAFVISVILLFGVIYAYMRAAYLDEALTSFIQESERMYRELHEGKSKNWRWKKIMQYSNSNNPNDWKFAIIEADVMLFELLESGGYVGSSVGEMLKNASPQSFQTLQSAWDAHKVRNNVAHSGTDFVLTKKVAQDTITQYKKVFQEFDIV